MDSHLYNATHPSIAPSLLSSAAVLSSLLLYHIAANPEEDRNVAAIAVDLDELWTTSLQYYTMYSVTQVWFSSNFLFLNFGNHLFGYHLGGSYFETAFCGPRSSQVYWSSIQVQIQVCFLNLFCLALTIVSEHFNFVLLGADLWPQVPAFAACWSAPPISRCREVCPPDLFAGLLPWHLDQLLPLCPRHVFLSSVISYTNCGTYRP